MSIEFTNIFERRKLCCEWLGCVVAVGKGSHARALAANRKICVRGSCSTVDLEGVQGSGRDQSEHGEEEGTCYNLGLVSAFWGKEKTELFNPVLSDYRCLGCAPLLLTEKCRICQVPLSGRKICPVRLL